MRMGAYQIQVSMDCSIQFLGLEHQTRASACQEFFSPFRSNPVWSSALTFGPNQRETKLLLQGLKQQIQDDLKTMLDSNSFQHVSHFVTRAIREFEKLQEGL